MNNVATPVEALFGKAERYGKTSIELLKLNAIDKSADVVSSLAAKLAVTIAVAMFVLIVNIGIALWLGELLGKTYYGFFVTSAFYAIVALLIYVFQKQWIIEPISNSVISQLLRNERNSSN